MLTEERQNKVVELCRDLIKIKSYSGEEANLAKKILEVFKRMCFDEVFTDEYGNVIGHIKGKHPGKSIVFEGHMDTVPVRDESKWSNNPFGGEVRDGKIYGRGATDMKGPLSAMICAASYFQEDNNRNFAGDIYVAGVVHEECFEGIASRKISERLNPDYVVIGEPTNLNLARGQRGRAEIVVETFGQSAHSSNPEKGINAVYNMMEVIEKIKGLELSHHDFFGYGILELTDIKSAPYPGASVVPDYCRATYDRRLLIGENKEEVLKPIQDIIDELEKQDPNFKGKTSYAIGEEKCYTGATIKSERFFPAWLYDENDEFIQTTHEALKKAGLDSQIIPFLACTNGSHYAGEAGIKTIIFGPSPVGLAHIDDEYIEISQLLAAVEGYYMIVKSLLV